MYFCLPKSDAAIKKISYIVRFLAGLVVVAVVGLILFTTLPASQRWLAGKVAGMLSDELGTDVHIGRAQIGLFNRVVLDDVLLLDQQQDTLLAATRLSVKMSLPALAEQKVRISAAQLFGFDIRLRRPSPEAPYNFQFLVDHFASEDTTSTPLDLVLSQVIMRRGRLSHDILSEPVSEQLSPAHLLLEDINLRFSIGTLTNDFISLGINNLSFTESRSGLTLHNLRTDLRATFPAGDDATLDVRDFQLLLPSSSISIPRAEAVLCRPAPSDSTSFPLSHLKAGIQGQLTPSDLAALLPALAPFGEAVSFSTEGVFADRQLTLENLSAEITNLLDLQADLVAGMPITTADAPFRLSGDLNRLQIKSALTQRVLSLLTDSGLVTPALAQTLGRLGDLQLTGNGSYSKALVQGEFELLCGIGKASVEGTFTHGDRFHLHLETEDLRLAQLVDEDAAMPLDHLTLQSDLQGSLRQSMLRGNLSSQHLHFQSEELDALQATFDLSPHLVNSHVELTDDHYSVRLRADLTSAQPLSLNLNALEHLSGQVSLSDLSIHDGQTDYHLDLLDLALENDPNIGHRVHVHGDFIDAQASGRFSYLTLGSSIQTALHRVLPSLIAAPGSGTSRSTDALDFKLTLRDSDPLFSLADLDLHLPEPAYIEGSFFGTDERLTLKADCPHVLYGSQDLRAVSLIAQELSDSLDLFLSMQRMMETGPLDVSVMSHGAADQLTSVVTWDDHNLPVQRGELSTRTLFRRDEQHQLGADITFLPTQIIVADTVWNVHPAQVSVSDGVADVHHFQISQLGRHLQVDGRISPHPEDTLYADLRHINLEYVFGIIDFHDVEFAGLATGKVKVHNFGGIPEVDAMLSVDDFTLNGGLLGHLSLDGGFGRKDDRAIDIDGLIREPQRGQLSHVVGIIKPGREPGRGIDLHVFADYINTYFINFFTEGIFTDLQGRATGYAHLFGPFGQLDLEGDLALDTLSVGIDVLNTRYHLHGGDSVHLRPGSIAFNNIRLYDSHHHSDNRAHEGILNGSVRFQHFKNMSYDFDIEAHDLLGYDFREFGNNSFYGTAFANGNVRLRGEPGRLDVDIQCAPTAGTVFTYNVSTPDATTDNTFINFKRPTPAPSRQGGQELRDVSLIQAGSPLSLVGGDGDESDDDELTDMRINFDLNITPEAQLRLLMDPRSEDYITLYGGGSIRATYYNKGTFQMYGTYRVDHGSYRLSLQDIIHKEFQFEQGSTLVFGGNPMKGDLNLRAIYTVPSVSLNDLAAGSNFSASSVRVNCIMRISGQAEQPQISFDFDIPNVNEDEKQMVRSLISTEEERNLQVIYLLGIGRFYTYGLAADENQTNSAMQSLLSSTLSGQLNDILSNAIGSKDWNFGTNFSTGQLGWQDMDVEGSLSGRLLNNRLLINGTFGYRDTPVANTNFIGDFDVRWLLTPSGTVSLKAYSETNDRYFTKSALTTQGIGIQLKKDFTSLRELFRRRR